MSGPTLAYLHVLRDDAATHDVGFVRQCILALLDNEIARRSTLFSAASDDLAVDLILAAVKNECAAKTDALAKLSIAEKERDQLREALRFEREACDDWRASWDDGHGLARAVKHDARRAAEKAKEPKP